MFFNLERPRVAHFRGRNKTKYLYLFTTCRKTELLVRFRTCAATGKKNATNKYKRLFVFFFLTEIAQFRVPILSE